MAKSQFREHLGIQIAAGQVINTSSIHKFGAAPEMSQNQTGTVWDIDDTLYPWDAFDTAGPLVLTSTSTEDDELKAGDVVGTGAHRVTVIGLDENYNEITEVLITNGTSTRTSTNNFKRVYRAFVSAGNANLGDLTLSRDGTDVLKIITGKSQTLMAIYTVPAGYTGFIMQGTMTVKSGADATGEMFVRYFGQDAFRIGHTFEVSGDGGQYFYPFATPIMIPEKSDIDIRATVRSNNARVTAAFDMILVERTVW